MAKQEFKFQGVVTFSAYEETEKDGKTYKKWQAVLEETGEQYPQMIKLDYFTNKDTCIPCPKVDDEIIAFYNIKAKEYNGKRYGENSVWKTELVKAGVATEEDDDMPPADEPEKPVARRSPKIDPRAKDDDDLPF